MKILRQNLIDALRLAIETQEKAEAAQGFEADSAFLSGLRDNLAALRAGEELRICP